MSDKMCSDYCVLGLLTCSVGQVQYLKIVFRLVSPVRPSTVKKMSQKPRLH